MATNNYFKSTDIQVFPCSYRGSYTSSDGTINIIDPESRMFTEATMKAQRLRANAEATIIACKTVGGKDQLEFFLHGYHFKISNLTKAELKNKYFVIKLLTTDIVSDGTDKRTTEILSSFEADTPAGVVDKAIGGTTYFTALMVRDPAFVTNSNEYGFIPFIDDGKGNTIVDLRLFAPDIDHGEGTCAIKEGGADEASGTYSHAEGNETNASGYASHAEGSYTAATNNNAHAEGSNTCASGDNSHAEGSETKATGDGAHAEGYRNTASGLYSHAEGGLARPGDVPDQAAPTEASGVSSHAEGVATIAEGNHSHAEGEITEASGRSSHAGGWGAKAIGKASFAHGYNVYASTDYMAAVGQYNEDRDDSLFEVGYGRYETIRKSALLVDKQGRVLINNLLSLEDNTQTDEVLFQAGKIDLKATNDPKSNETPVFETTRITKPTTKEIELTLDTWSAWRKAIKSKISETTANKYFYIKDKKYIMLDISCEIQITTGTAGSILRDTTFECTQGMGSYWNMGVDVSYAKFTIPAGSGSEVVLNTSLFYNTLAPWAEARGLDFVAEKFQGLVNIASNETYAYVYSGQIGTIAKTFMDTHILFENEHNKDAITIGSALAKNKLKFYGTLIGEHENSKCAYLHICDVRFQVQVQLEGYIADDYNLGFTINYIDDNESVGTYTNDTQTDFLQKLIKYAGISETTGTGKYALQISNVWRAQKGASNNAYLSVNHVSAEPETNQIFILGQQTCIIQKNNANDFSVNHKTIKLGHFVNN